MVGTLVLDIGSGFNTPSVVRWPMERVATQLLNARLARINLDHPEVPSELGARGLAYRTWSRRDARCGTRGESVTRQEAS